MKKTLKITSLFILILLLSAVLLSVYNTAPEQRSREIEEAAIYSLILIDTCKSKHKDSPVLIVGETYSHYSTYVNENLISFWQEPLLDKDIFDDYQIVNQNSITLNSNLVPNNGFCKLFSFEELAPASKLDSNWYNSHMLISFSAIGFNKSFDQAIVYKEYNCGGECAGGDTYYLTRQGNSWKIKRIISGFRS